MRKRTLRVLILLVGVVAFSASEWGALTASAQTPYIPYYGKNRPRYVTFEWYIYKTDHFDIFYYPELEPHLARVTAYAESAYQKISADLKHDLADRIPLVLFKTQADFQLQNITGFELPEGVLAFAEPERNRMVLPIDEPPDQLYRLITHELTHVFEFDIIPRGIMSDRLPLWVDEGLANYMAGYWNILDLMQVRDAALTDSIPKMSRFHAEALSGRLPYSLGHAVFEFIEARWGKEGIRQFLFSLRKTVVGGGDSAYEEALKLTPEDFDDQFDRYLKERFKPYRDKERPADYGRNVGPNIEETPYVTVLSIEPSPAGDMIAAVVGNRRDYELDIVLLSAKDGRDIKNVTKGFDKDRGFEYISTSGGLRGNLMPWISWGPDDTIAYFARTERSKTLIVQNIVNGKTMHRINLERVDSPESPAFSPDGRLVAFSGLQGAITDIFTVNLATGDVTNVTNDQFANYAPTFSPDGRHIVYSARVSSNDKLFMLDLGTGQKKQITFGTHDDFGAKFVDEKTLVFTSTATDPTKPQIDDPARTGSIPNIWTLDTGTGKLTQWTDSATGLVSPVVLRTPGPMRFAFVSYYKGENGIHTLTADKPIATAETADFGSPDDPVIDFTPPFSHTVVQENIHKKGSWERMSLASRPPIGLGVTSGGNFYGNTELTFTDVLGDKQINFYAQQLAQYRTTALSYVNIERRLQYALQGFSIERFYYGRNTEAALFYDPSLAPFVDRDSALAVQTTRGATAFGIYPFNRYSRVELYGGYMHMRERYADPNLQQAADDFQEDRFGQALFRTGHVMPLGVAFVQETTVFREYGPVSGSTMRVAFDASPAFNDNWLSRRTVDVDLRHYTRLVANGVLAVRLRGQKSWGTHPDLFFFGGNSEMRGYDYLEFLGHHGFFANAELRYPLIEAMLTPMGVVGGLRGVFFANVGGAGIRGEKFKFWSSSPELHQPLVGFNTDFFGFPIPEFGPPILVDGLRLVDARASYGIGLESFLLGFPMHFDWSWRTLFNADWEDVLFAPEGVFNGTTGSQWFRKPRFTFWIGYDF